MTIKYNWQHPNWPNFTFDTKSIEKVINDYTKISSNLQGQVEQFKQENKSEAYIYLIVEEAINTSEIEGESLNREQVRSSVARYLDLELSQPKGIFHKENGIASLLVDVRSHFNKDLTKAMICTWHKLLLTGQDDYYARRDIKIGDYRNGPVHIVTGNAEYEEVIFEGPPSESVEAQMADFILWYNSSSPLNITETYLAGPIRAAIAHMWFTSIHPFGDGNGRIGRAISEHALFQDFESPPLFSISTPIVENRHEYYAMLAQSSRITPSVNLTSWVQWFAQMTKNAQIDAKKKLDFILKKSNFWDSHKAAKLNKRQQKVINKCFEFGEQGLVQTGINSEKYQQITGCSPATATRDLKALVYNGMFEPSQSGGRSLKYFIKLTGTAPVFNIAPQKGDKKLQAISLNKLLGDMQRNIDFHQTTNRKLDRLILKYKEFANEDIEHLNRLETILSGVDGK